MLGRLRWANVPLPEPHLIGLGVGILAQVLSPWRLPLPRGLGVVVGLALGLGGLAVAGWAVWTAGGIHLAHPGQLVEDGPYARSRNPMYVGWTLMYTGVALLLGNVWLLVLLPLVLAVTHAAVISEERRLARQFGRQFEGYTARVRRYL